MKAAKIFKSFDALSLAPDAWRGETDRPEANPAAARTDATEAFEFATPPEEFALAQPYRRWGINE